MLAYAVLLCPLVMWSHVAAFGHHRHAHTAPGVLATPALPTTIPSEVSPLATTPALAESKAMTTDPNIDLGTKSAKKSELSNDELPDTKAIHACILLVDGKRRVVITSARTVREFLAEQHVALRPNDRVMPLLASPVPSNGITRVQRVHAWIHHEIVKIPAPIIHHHDSSLFVGEQRILHKGHAGTRVRLIAIRTVDGQTSTRHLIKSRVMKHVDPEIVAVGTRKPLVGSWPEFTSFALSRTAVMAHTAFNMIATAYIAYCDTCTGTGRGASGMLVTHGVVAVDPHVIALGSHLYIPGYGPAIAGDTGGAIIGNRIDLAMNSLADAVNFGRRIVTIYVLDSGHH